MKSEPVSRLCVSGPYPPHHGGMSLQLFALEKRLRRAGVEVKVLPTNLNPPRRLAFVRKIKGLRTLVRGVQYFFESAKIIKKVDGINHFVCSGLYFFVHTLPLVILANIYGKKIVLAYHSGTANRFLSRWGLFVVPIIQLADHLTVPSEFLYRVFRAHGMSPTILPNIVESDLFEFQARRKLRPRLLCTRQLESVYNLDCVLRAFVKVQQDYPSAALGIAGSGSLETKLRELANELRLRDVFFLGTIEHAQLSEVFAEYDIFVNASSVDNFPGSVVEAACTGMPIVTTRAGGIPDMIEHGVNGLLVDVGDHEALAAAVLILLHDQELARQLALSARDWVESFGWDETYNQFANLFTLPEKSGPAHNQLHTQHVIAANEN